MPTFEDNEQLYDFIIENNIHDYQKLISVFNINIVCNEELPKHYLGVAVPRINTIFINPFNNTISKDFIIAHEVCHVLLGIETSAFYNSSYVTNIKIEKVANNGAIFLLLRQYFSNITSTLDFFSIENFLETYKIPYMYYFQVEELISNYKAELTA